MNAEEIRKSVDEYCEKEGINVEFKQVPKSLAKNAREDDKHSCAYWDVTITCGRGSVTVPYSEGEGNFIAQTFGRRSVRDAGYIDAFKRMYLDNCERTEEMRWWEVKDMGVFFREFARKDRVKLVSVKGKKQMTITPPTPAGIFYCLCRDYDVMDSGGFEDWASDFGYDTDSRKAENIYKACMEQSLKLRAVLGETRIYELRELTQDL